MNKKIVAFAATAALAACLALTACGGSQGSSSSAASASAAASSAAASASAASASAASASAEASSAAASESAAAASASAAAPSAAASSASAYIGDEAAIDIALKDAGFAKDGVSELECELDLDDATIHYDVSFKDGATEYDYDIDATSGAILKVDSEIDDD